MAHFHLSAGQDAVPATPIVRRIGPADLKNALAKGFDDFQAMPTHVIFVGLFYPIIGLFFARLVFGYEMMPLLYPLISGFALVGPLAAIPLFELSRRRELGLDTSWEGAFDLVRRPSLGSIVALGMLLTAIFVCWLFVAQALYGALFGQGAPASIAELVSEVLYTRRGWTLIVLGNSIGFVFALIVLSISVVSFPLLLEHQVGVVEAVRTSVRAVLASPLTMALWGLIVALMLAVGFATLFVGLAIVMPILGHSTWHLYRRVVAAGGAQP